MVKWISILNFCYQLINLSGKVIFFSQTRSPSIQLLQNQLNPPLNINILIWVRIYTLVKLPNLMFLYFYKFIYNCLCDSYTYIITLWTCIQQRGKQILMNREQKSLNINLINYRWQDLCHLQQAFYNDTGEFLNVYSSFVLFQ